MADMQPTDPSGVVPLMVSRISRQRTGLTFLNSSVNQRCLVASASDARPFVRTTALRSSHVAAEPAAAEGCESQSHSDATHAYCPQANTYHPPRPSPPPAQR